MSEKCGHSRATPPPPPPPMPPPSMVVWSSSDEWMSEASMRVQCRVMCQARTTNERDIHSSKASTEEKSAADIGDTSRSAERCNSDDVKMADKPTFISTLDVENGVEVRENVDEVRSRFANTQISGDHRGACVTTRGEFEFSHNGSVTTSANGLTTASENAVKTRKTNENALSTSTSANNQNSERKRKCFTTSDSRVSLKLDFSSGDAGTGAVPSVSSSALCRVAGSESNSQRGDVTASSQGMIRSTGTGSVELSSDDVGTVRNSTTSRRGARRGDNALVGAGGGAGSGGDSAFAFSYDGSTTHCTMSRRCDIVAHPSSGDAGAPPRTSTSMFGTASSAIDGDEVRCSDDTAVNVATRTKRSAAATASASAGDAKPGATADAASASDAAAAAEAATASASDAVAGATADAASASAAAAAAATTASASDAAGGATADASMSDAIAAAATVMASTSDVGVAANGTASASDAGAVATATASGSNVGAYRCKCGLSFDDIVSLVAHDQRTHQQQQPQRQASEESSVRADIGTCLYTLFFLLFSLGKRASAQYISYFFL